MQLNLLLQEAINIISHPNDPKPPVSKLAADVGFSSRTSFVSAFWKHTGMMPSTFITNYKQLLREGG
jgi:AraC-like DNA-binding protein